MILGNNPSVSEREKLYLQDQLKAEQLCVTKCNVYSQQAQDPQIRNLVENMRSACQRRVDTLNSVMGRFGISQPS